MRKASQDGGDSTSITSGFENEFKRAGAGLIKSKKTSIKRKVQNFSLESDDGVGEPLLQKDKDKEKPESGNQSAKFLLSKTKTDSMSDKGDDKDKLLSDDVKSEMPSMTSVPGITDNQTLANGIKDSQTVKPASADSIHNYMNTNVFSGSEAIKSIAPKSQILVEIEGNKTKSYNSSPLIFTTAKIHSDGKTKPMEPVQMTPVPISSTIEGRVVKSETVIDHFCDNNILSSFKKDHINNMNVKSAANDTSKTRETLVSGVVGGISACLGTSNKEIIPSLSENKSPIVSKITTTITCTTKSIGSQLMIIKNLSHDDKLTSVQSQVKNDIVNTVKDADNIQHKYGQPTKTLPQTTFTNISETKVAAMENKDARSSQSSSTIKSASTECNGKISTPIVAGSVPRTIAMNINKNIHSVYSIGEHAPETSTTTSLQTNAKVTTGIPKQEFPNNVKITTGILKQDQANEATASNLSSKPLQQKKPAEKEQTKTSATGQDVKSKALDNEKSKLTYTSSENLQNVKVSCTSPKQCANSFVTNSKIPTSKSSAVSTSVKMSVQSSVPSSSITPSKPIPILTEIIASKTPASTATTVTYSVSTVKTSLNLTTAGAKTIGLSKPTATTAANNIPKLGTISVTNSPKPDLKFSSAAMIKPIPTIYGNNTSKPVVTTVTGTAKLSSTKSVTSTSHTTPKTSTTSTVKPLVIMSSASGLPVNPSVLSSAKILPSEAPAKTGTTVSTTQTKSSTVSTMKTSTTKLPITSKLINSNSVATTSGSATSKSTSNKQIGANATNQNKEDKSKV